MAITIMGKTIGKTDAEKDEAYARKMAAQKRKQDRRIIREQMKEASAATKKQWEEQKEQRRLAKERQRAEMEQARLERAEKKYKTVAKIEQHRARISEARTREAMGTKRRRAASPIASVARGISHGVTGVNRSLADLTYPSRKPRVGRPRSRAVYVSTSHGLKRVDGYYGAGAVPHGTPPPRIKSDDDDWGQAGAFSGF